MNEEELRDRDLSQFRRGGELYQSASSHVVYTEGIRYLAEECGACWLVDTIVSSFGGTEMKNAMAADSRLKIIQCWQLDMIDEDTAVIAATADSNKPPFIAEQIPYIDFPFKQVRILACWDGERWILMLRSEH